MSASGAWVPGNGDAANAPDAASPENVAVTTYETALSLPLIGGDEADVVVNAFMMKTRFEHVEHVEALKAVTQRLSRRPQTGVSTMYQSVVDAALPGLRVRSASLGSR